MKNIFEEEKLYLDNVKELIKKQEDYHKKELLEIPGRYTNVLQGETILVEILMSEQATKLRKLEMAEKDNFDYIIRGYGEKPTYYLLEHLIKNKRKINSIPNLVYRKNEELVLNEFEELPTDIDSLPSPYLTNIDFFPERKIVFTSRGCIHNCTYCNCPIMCNRKIKFHSIKRVIEELKYISKKEKNSYVLLGDDAFTLNVERAKEICRQIIDNKIKLNLFCETRVDKIDEELLLLLKEAGFIKIDFGLESATPRILRNVKKVFYSDSDKTYNAEKSFLEKMKKTVLMAKEYNLDPMVNIITGLPGESINDAKNTIKFIKELNINSYSHNYLKIYSGTEIFNKYKECNYVLEENAFKLPYIIRYPIDVTKVMPLNNSVSRNEVVRLKKAFIQKFKNKEYYIFSNLKLNKETIKTKLNEEIFVLLENECDIKELSNYIVSNLIPTNNIVCIIKHIDYIKCFNLFDKENFIIMKIVKDDKFEIPNNYYTLLYIDKFNTKINKRLKDLNVNPYINRFIVLNKDKDIKKKDKIKLIIDDYINVYSLDKKVYEVLISFVNKINYELDDIKIELLIKLLKENEIDSKDLIYIKDFLYYYLMEV